MSAQLIFLTMPFHLLQSWHPNPKCHDTHAF